ncbi:bifunctional biotin--[acetyl-CoA-carboxylase] synthetase/biotin operon repressor [Carboxydothermus islandicus]|uniref:Bifunctional ligase/repressor BirA n=1 Tax=Carboxydothermus islandicus TaxID=661089 RepID=A0A1L8D4F2_9THEO|nr:biotin--[acetyl-CoA-carboxylase] ligase [Carboxydothermus islandicus]GAV26053.1 bifunctional biotin--[acetyl-CoA-carboxylase] synthetase/biotin operon repressor [Carboxydothermus islandicus]
MKDEIISMLVKSQDYVSGEEISQKLGVTRTAIWKHIKELKREGYKITAHPRKGYKLEHYPDIPAYYLLKPFLKTSYLGHTGEYHDLIGSTNDRAKELAASKVPEGFLVSANGQTAGRGRLGRSWNSPSGQGLYFSLVLYPNLPPVELPGLTLLAGLALAQTLEVLGVNVQIKWPNDLLINGRKVAGILTEIAAEAERTIYAVVGIGINIEPLAEEVKSSFAYPATALKEHLPEVSRQSLLALFLERFEKLYEEFKKGEFSWSLTEYKRRMAFLGEEVMIITGDREYRGVLHDLGEDGSLIINDGKTIKRFAAGEISLRRKEEGEDVFSG